MLIANFQIVVMLVRLDNAGDTHSNDVDKANLLNNYFSSVGTLDDGLTPDVALLVHLFLKATELIRYSLRSLLLECYAKLNHHTLVD